MAESESINTGVTFEQWLKSFAETDRARQLYRSALARQARLPRGRVHPLRATQKPADIAQVISRVPNSIFAMGAMAGNGS